MDNEENYRFLKEQATGMGVSLFGVCGIESVKKEIALSEELLKKLKYGISLGVRLSDGIIEDIIDHPTQLYFWHYRNVNNLLDQVAIRMGSLIQEKGYMALPVPSSQIVEWNGKMRALASHRKIGLLAGLGWRGRNNLLVNKGIGARFRLVTVLTDMPLKCDKELETDCGDCVKCIEVCPGKAIDKDVGSFDRKKCFETIDAFKKEYKIQQHICGLCMKACKKPSLASVR
jgi:epoxyqueuosine reductase QueG